MWSICNYFLNFDYKLIFNKLVELKIYLGLKLLKLFKMCVYYNYVIVYKLKLKGWFEMFIIIYVVLF